MEVLLGAEREAPGWGMSGGWRGGRAGLGGDSHPPSPRQVPRAPRRGEWAAVTRLRRVWLLLCCLPAGSESRRRCQGASPLQPGPWPAGLLGNQESQAQLIKLWAEAMQGISGTQDPQKLKPMASPEPFLHGGCQTGGGLLPATTACSVSPLHFSPIAPLPQHTPPGLPPAPSRPGGCEDIREPGSSREGQQNAEAKQAEESRKPRTAGMKPTSPCRRGTISQISHPIFISPLPSSPLPVTCLGGSVVKNPPASAEDLGWIPGLGRSPGGGNAIHSSILPEKIPATAEPGQATVRGVANSQT